MCGICGVLLKNRKVIESDRNLLAAMMESIKHRGPDESGVYEGDLILLGHRRLSIIDLRTGHQPIGNEHDNIWVVYNGEIYNYEELKNDLESMGHVFRTCTDTEVIVHAYEQWGTDCLKKFNGMFSFALWDNVTGSLLLARDRVGKKPLYFFEDNELFLFASELKALLKYPQITKRLSSSSLSSYLYFGYIPGDDTIFENIGKLLPAHFLMCSMNSNRIEPYWELNCSEDVKDEAGIREKLLELLRNAVSIRLMSDVPLGAFLSGGIDSSLVVYLMHAASKTRVKTFSVGFAEKEYNELPDAGFVANALGTEHHELILEPQHTDLLFQLVKAYDEPFADSSALPTYLVSHFAAQHVKVVLSGDGGDELFGGYRRYLESPLEKMQRFLPPFLQRICAGISHCSPEAFPGKHFLHALNNTPLEHYLSKIGCFPDIGQTLLNAELLQHRGEEKDMVEAFMNRVEHCSRLSRESYFDFRVYLPDDILVKVDRASMANSLEVRAPLLDYRIAELAFSLSPDLKIRNGSGKCLLKGAAKEILPERVLSKRKQGFAVPLGKWFKDDLNTFIGEIVTDPGFIRRGYFNAKAVEQMLDLHTRGVRDYSGWLWRLIILELWHRNYVDVAAAV